MPTENLLTTKTVKTIDPKDIDVNRLYVLVMFDNKVSLDDIVIVGRFMHNNDLVFEILLIKPLSGSGIWKRDTLSEFWWFYESSIIRKDNGYYEYYINLEDYMEYIRQVSAMSTDITHENGVNVKLETYYSFENVTTNDVLSTISAKPPHTEDDSSNDNLPWYKKLWKKLTNKKVTTDISDKGNSVYVASGSDNVVIGNITQISNNTEIRKEE